MLYFRKMILNVSMQDGLRGGRKLQARKPFSKEPQGQDIR